MMRDSRQQRLRANGDPIGTLEPGALVKTWYHLTDTLFSTIAIIDDNADLMECVSHDAYGMARHHHAADINSDGVVTQEDYDMVTQHLGNFGVGNITRTGTVNGRDQSLANDSLAALPPGEISTTDNIVGYAGYHFNAEIHGAGMYTVRHRRYAPDLGRWLTRDPIGYVDGMNLYEYVRSAPNDSIDPGGLFRLCTGWRDGGWRAAGYTCKSCTVHGSGTAVGSSCVMTCRDGLAEVKTCSRTCLVPNRCRGWGFRRERDTFEMERCVPTAGSRASSCTGRIVQWSPGRLECCCQEGSALHCVPLGSQHEGGRCASWAR